jgi:hypothetical protein
MRNFLGNIEEPISINLQLSITHSLKFYKFSMVEVTVENENKLINEITKLIHNTIIQKENNVFSSQLEIFDRELRNRSFSISEKVYASRIADINDDIIAQITSHAVIEKILNLKEIQQKVVQTIEKLNETYKGVKAEVANQFLINFYGNQDLLIADLYGYHQLGMLLNSYYGKHRSDTNRVRQVRYITFMENTLVNIEEQFKIKKIDDTLKEVAIEIKGTIIEPFYKSMFEREMGLKKITFDTKKDKPTLEKYDGSFIFNMDTGEVKSASIDIVFSFGSNYVKTIHYHLKEMLQLD